MELNLEHQIPSKPKLNGSDLNKALVLREEEEDDELDGCLLVWRAFGVPSIIDLSWPENGLCHWINDEDHDDDNAWLMIMIMMQDDDNDDD